MNWFTRLMQASAEREAELHRVKAGKTFHSSRKHLMKARSYERTANVWRNEKEGK